MNMLIICLALVLLSSILLFVYFKSRVGKVEEKLDIMFQLVQSHASQQQNSMKIYENNGINEQVNNHLGNNSGNHLDINSGNHLDINSGNHLEQQENLISVSDEEDSDDSDSDDSDENDTDENDTDENDTDSEDELVIGEDIKKISLNLENNDENEEDVPIILEKTEDVLSEEDLNTDILEEVSIDNLSIEEEVDYDKFRVAELKQMCQEKDLDNYKKLKKSDLIELLKNN